MSYTPNGLFNHTAAIYQMMTGYTTDKVSPSGQLEPPDPKDFPNFGSQHRPAQAADGADAAVRDAAAAAAGVQRRRQGRARPASSAGRSTRTRSIPDGDDMDMTKMDRIKIDDLQLRPEVFAIRLERRAKLRDAINAGMPEIDKAVADYNLDAYYDRALSLVLSRPGPRRVRPDREEPAKTRDLYGRNTFGQSCLLARRLVEAGTRVVEVIWPKVANSDNHSWDHHVDLTKRMKTQSGPMLDAGLSGLLADLDERGLLERDAGRRRRRVRPQPAEGRQHLRQRQQRRRPRPLAVLLHRRRRRRRHQARPRPRRVGQDRLQPRARTRSTPASCWPRSTTPSASTRTRSSTTT